MVFKTKERVDKLENRVDNIAQIINRHENEIKLLNIGRNIILKDLKKTIDNLIDLQEEK